MTMDQADAAAQPGDEPQAPDAVSLPPAPESLALDGIMEAFASLPDEPTADLPGTGDEQDTQEPPRSEERAPDASPPSAEGEPEGQPKRTAAEWAAVLLRDGEQRLAEISPREQSSVLLEYAKLQRQAGAEDAHRVITEQLAQRDQAQRYVAQVDAHFGDDPDGELAWRKSTDPEVRAQVRAYDDAKTWLAQLEGKPQEQQVAEITALNDRARREYSRLTRFPELQTELEQRRQAGRYPASDSGINQLQADVDELLERAATGGGNGTTGAPATVTQPARRPVARPVVPTTGGTGAIRPRTAPRPASEISDPGVLAFEGISEGMRSARRA